MPKTKLPAVVSTFCLCFVFWLLLTWSFTAQEMIAGAVVSLAVALFTSHFFIHEDAFWLLRPAKLAALISYAFVFLAELVKANVDVAGRCFAGCRDVNPGIVKVPVDLKGDYAEDMLANSITLTPGTYTVKLEGKEYAVHALDDSFQPGIEYSAFFRMAKKLEEH